MNPRVQRLENSEHTDPVLLDGETIAYTAEVSSFELAGESLGTGRMHLTNQRIVFVPSIVETNVVIFGYRSVALHAISARDETKCIFIQLMSNDETVESDEDDDVNENNDNVVEIFFRNEDCVAEFFEQMNAMSAFHPDIDSDDEGDYDDAYDDKDAGDGSVPE